MAGERAKEPYIGDQVAPLVGWRNVRTGVVHARTECAAWERVRAEDVETVTVRFGVDRLCSWCFNSEGRKER